MATEIKIVARSLEELASMFDGNALAAEESTGGKTTTRKAVIRGHAEAATWSQAAALIRIAKIAPAEPAVKFRAIGEPVDLISAFRAFAAHMRIQRTDEAVECASHLEAAAESIGDADLAHLRSLLMGASSPPASCLVAICESDEIAADRPSVEPPYPTYVVEIEVKVIDADALMHAAAIRAIKDGIKFPEWMRTREEDGDPMGSDLQMILDPGYQDGKGFEIEESRVRRV
jgi:hypothetical protein